MYLLIDNTGIIYRLKDSAFIPPCPGNRDYQEYLEWIAAGNAAERRIPFEETKEGRIGKIDTELATLDTMAPRGLEDLIEQLKAQLSFDDSKLPLAVRQVLARKAELREQRKMLTSASSARLSSPKSVEAK